jgi:hypothetical protein
MSLVPFYDDILESYSQDANSNPDAQVGFVSSTLISLSLCGQCIMITSGKEIYMSRLSKVLSLTVVIVFLLACNFVTQPINDAQNLAQTAQALGTAIPIETLQALPSLIPAETLQALPSSVPTFEAIATQFGNYFDPQGTPVQEWKGIPIMPQATAGQEFSENNSYSFRVPVTVKEVQDFYKEKMTALGWNQPLDLPLAESGGIIGFQKEGSVLTLTITSLEGSVVVLLTLA